MNSPHFSGTADGWQLERGGAGVVGGGAPLTAPFGGIAIAVTEKNNRTQLNCKVLRGMIDKWASGSRRRRGTTPNMGGHRMRCDGRDFMAFLFIARG
jgi:hypothetical protein